MMGAQRNTERKQQAGFSLLELLVALALLAILTTLLMGALQFGTQVWRRGNPVVEAGDLVVAYRTLQTNIERTLPIPESVPEPAEQPSDRVIAFDGSADALTFVIANPGHIGLLGDTVLRLALIPGDGTQFLGLSWAPYDPRIRLSVGTFNETLIVLGDVRSVSFRYFGVKKDGGNAHWSGDWQRQAALPRLVGIEFKTADGRQCSWSFRIAAPR